MGASAEDLYELLRAIRMDCSDIQSKITSAFTMLADLNLEDVPHVACPWMRPTHGEPSKP